MWYLFLKMTSQLHWFNRISCFASVFHNINLLACNLPGMVPRLTQCHLALLIDEAVWGCHWWIRENRQKSSYTVTDMVKNTSFIRIGPSAFSISKDRICLEKDERNKEKATQEESFEKVGSYLCWERVNISSCWMPITETDPVMAGENEQLLLKVIYIWSLGWTGYTGFMLINIELDKPVQQQICLGP